MLRYILLSFFFLGWAFFEVSGGTDFTAKRQAEKAAARAEAKAEQIKLAQARTDDQVVTDAMVTRATFSPVPTTAPPRPATDPVVAAAAPQPMTTRAEEVLNQPAPTSASQGTDADQPAALPDIRQVTGTRVNMRNGPSTNYNVILRLTRGTRVLILQEPGNGWVKLKVEDNGRVGWMASKLLSPVQG